MRRASHRLGIVLIAASISACDTSKEPSAMTPPSSGTSKPAADPLESKLGQLVTVEGIAEDAKLGALLLIGSHMVWIDGLHSWPKDARGKLVRVTGKVIERSDLPVFVERPGEPIMQGMPVPAGTDVEKASRRLLLTDAKWKLVETHHGPR